MAGVRIVVLILAVESTCVQTQGTTTTTGNNTQPWDSSASSNSQPSLGSSYSGSLNQIPWTSDWSQSQRSFGSTASGSSGFFLQLWQWVALIACVCCCLGGIVALIVLSSGRKGRGKKDKGGKSKQANDVAPVKSYREYAPQPGPPPPDRRMPDYNQDQVLPLTSPLTPMVYATPVEQPSQSYPSYSSAPSYTAPLTPGVPSGYADYVPTTSYPIASYPAGTYPGGSYPGGSYPPPQTANYPPSYPSTGYPPPTSYPTPGGYPGTGYSASYPSTGYDRYGASPPPAYPGTSSFAGPPPSYPPSYDRGYGGGPGYGGGYQGI